MGPGVVSMKEISNAFKNRFEPHDARFCKFCNGMDSKNLPPREGLYLVCKCQPAANQEDTISIQDPEVVDFSTTFPESDSDSQIIQQRNYEEMSDSDDNCDCQDYESQHKMIDEKHVGAEMAASNEKMLTVENEPF